MGETLTLDALFALGALLAFEGFQLLRSEIVIGETLTLQSLVALRALLTRGSSELTDVDPLALNAKPGVIVGIKND